MKTHISFEEGLVYTEFLQFVCVGCYKLTDTLSNQFLEPTSTEQ
jgi:hypothetical protein